MARPKTSWRVARVVLLAVARGATIGDAAVAAGISPRTVDRLVDEHGRMCFRDRTRGSDGLSLADREEIRVGIDRRESNEQIGKRIGRHRSTVWHEIKVNGGRDAYRAFAAEERACDVALRPRQGWTETRPELWEEINSSRRPLETAQRTCACRTPTASGKGEAPSADEGASCSRPVLSGRVGGRGNSVLPRRA